MSDYNAAVIDASVKVKLIRRGDKDDVWGASHALREVSVILNETFKTDGELELAVAAFAQSILEAARR